MKEKVHAVERKTDSKSKQPGPELSKSRFPSLNSSYIDRVLFLQRTIGNREVTRLIRFGVLQKNNGSDSTILIQRACQYFAEHSAPDTYCQTRAEAEALVTRANPSSCFVYNDGPADHQWRPIPGFGCAHYVAHQLGITEGPDYANCRDGFSVTIGQITQGRAREALTTAQVGDIWTNDGESHSGVVREVGSGARAGQVRIQACGTIGNIYTIWTSDGVVHH